MNLIRFCHSHLGQKTYLEQVFFPVGKDGKPLGCQAQNFSVLSGSLCLDSTVLANLGNVSQEYLTSCFRSMYLQMPVSGPGVFLYTT